jgi:hypothetical protein
MAVDTYLKNNVVDGDSSYTFRQAMLDAGYSKLYISRYGQALSNNVLVKKQIDDIVLKIQNRVIAKVAISKEWVINEHIEALGRCKEKGDEANATANIIAIGRTMGLYSDNVNIADTERIEQVNKRILQDAKVFASIAMPRLLSSKGEIDARGGGRENVQLCLPENRSDNTTQPPDQPEESQNKNPIFATE